MEAATTHNPTRRGKAGAELDDEIRRDGVTRAIVLHPDVSRRATGEPEGREAEDRLSEALGLARAIDLEIEHSEVVRVNKLRPATLFGSGIVERFEQFISASEIEVAIIDRPLSPIQQRNLERAWHCKVIDRTALILEIFGARARTHEGRLQVELAALTFQRSRLVRSWTHLERQRGGAGFLGGPGESQIELDRRQIDDKIIQLKHDLDRVVRTRSLHRAARKRTPHPIVAFVGYTNAGKSTLFNRLTGSDVFAQDMLFATLDPTMRRLTLPSGREIILSDTVGFISDLPTHLVAAFRATLEEVLEADIIVHVRDISHPDTEFQKQDVEAVLDDLGVLERMQNGHSLEALNKVDLLEPEERDALMRRIEPHQVVLSAVTGEGCPGFVERVEAMLGAADLTLHYDIDPADGAAIAWLHQHGKVLEQIFEDDHLAVSVVLAPDDVNRFNDRFSTKSRAAG
jgi:GTP-binding protein HflX